ncbi:hypothetical protein HELRODRAFT_172942 [Helobdella robusta]|uniref:SUEL-type lectin domain-containing protein n=1 Tax=Helobdella robusta TaxID=6412 RepID=T1F665_HELRO|nr:hypothetical protein HELRODRAFT_172942 [Helobdella robusta]ESO03914.1 hypothetical protein HELRODRAFT_172942 [Helobdella robusta]
MEGEFQNTFFNKKLAELKFALDRVSHLPVHDALTIVRNALKPSGISALDGKRPDGCTLIPWRAGRCLAWDVTVPGTLAERYVHLTSKESGLAATRASDEKFKKYEGALPSMDFLPVCIELMTFQLKSVASVEKEVCNFETWSVRCSQLHDVLFIVSALYGRIAVGKCVRDDLGVVGCHVDGVQLLNALCLGRKDCVVNVEEVFAGVHGGCGQELKNHLLLKYQCIRVQGAKVFNLRIGTSNIRTTATCSSDSATRGNHTDHVNNRQN